MRATLLALLIATYASSATPENFSTIVIMVKDVKCLAMNIYHEARGEPLAGQVAVAAVTVNRSRDKRFPNGICEVVYQRDQFSWVGKGLPVNDLAAMANSYTIAAMYLQGLHPDPTKGALFFHSTRVNPGWEYKRATRIGTHKFYKA